MVGDQHQRSAGEGAADAARGVCDDQNLDAELSEHPRRQPGDPGRMPLIKMKAPRLHEHGDLFERPANQQAFVPGHAGFGKTGDGVVGNANGIDDFVGEKPESRAEDDRDAGFKLAQALLHCICRCCYAPRPSAFALPHYSRIPASVAERKFASVPAIIARNPRRARSCFRSGARAPMPPI